MDNPFALFNPPPEIQPAILGVDLTVHNQVVLKMEDANDLHIAAKAAHSKPHILFVCGRNKWRSPTAERIYKNDQRIEVRSAGMSNKSKHQISNGDIAWADLILVMEKKYKAWILSKFSNLPLPRIDSLDIPDEFEFMDKELIELLTRNVEFYIAGFDS